MENTATHAPVAAKFSKKSEATAKPAELSLLQRIPVSQRRMLVDDFVTIESNPRQRDTQRHLNKAIKKHFRTASPTHKRVNIAVLSGQMFKIDGHTRALAWSLGMLERPDMLNVDVYHCETIEDVKTLYGHFDTKDQTEDTPDMTSGAAREAGLSFKSDMLKEYRFAGALRAASRCFGETETVDIYQNVLEFADELAMLDAIGPSNKSLWRVGVIAGAVICFRKHGTKVTEFFERFNKNLGQKGDGVGDGVEALYSVVTTKKGKSGFSETIMIAAKTISAVENWMVKGEYKMGANGPKSLKETKLAGYLGGMRKNDKQS